MSLRERAYSIANRSKKALAHPLLPREAREILVEQVALQVEMTEKIAELDSIAQRLIDLVTGSDA